MDLYSGFRIVLFSHPDYDHLTAEIYFGDSFVALLFQDEGIYKIALNCSTAEYNLADFQEAFELAKKKLAGEP